MKKLPSVEEAKTLFTEAQNWSVWRWLMEKKRARRAADAANAALDQLEEEVKAGWNGSRSRDPKLRAAVERVREADEQARQARLEAEATFDEAERCLSAAMAREGARMAIASWELHEAAIRKAEAVRRLVG